MAVQREHVPSPLHSHRISGSRKSIDTAAIRRGEVKISSPILLGDEASPVSEHGFGSAPARTKDVRPPQPPQFEGLYDGRPPNRNRRMISSAGEKTFRAKSPAQNAAAQEQSRNILGPVTDAPNAALRDDRGNSRATSLRHPKRTMSPGTMVPQVNTTARPNSAVATQAFGSAGFGGSQNGPHERIIPTRRNSGSIKIMMRKLFGSSNGKKDPISTYSSQSSNGERLNQSANKAELDLIYRARPVTSQSTLRAETSRPSKATAPLPSESLGHNVSRSQLPFPMNVNAPGPIEPTPKHTTEQAVEMPSVFPERRRATLPELGLSPGDVAQLVLSSGSRGLLGASAATPPLPSSLADPQANTEIQKPNDFQDMLHNYNKTADTYATDRLNGGEPSEKVNSAYGAIATKDFASTTAQSEKQADQDSFETWAGVRLLDEDSDDENEEPYRDRTRARSSFDDAETGLRSLVPTDRSRLPKPSSTPAIKSTRKEAARTPTNPELQTEVAKQLRPTEKEMQHQVSHTRNFSRPVAEKPLDSAGSIPFLSHFEERLSRLEQMMRDSEASRNETVIPTRFGDRSWTTVSDGADSTAVSAAAPSRPPSESAGRATPPRKIKALESFRFGRRTERTDNGGDSSSDLGTSQRARSSSRPRPVTAQAGDAPTRLPSPGMYEHLAPLYAALRYERDRRKECEVQIKQMRQELNDINVIVRQDSQRISDLASRSPVTPLEPLDGLKLHRITQKPTTTSLPMRSALDEADIDRTKSPFRKLEMNLSEQIPKQHKLEGNYPTHDDPSVPVVDRYKAPVETRIFMYTPPPTETTVPALHPTSSSSRGDGSGGSKSGIPTRKNSSKNLRSQYSQETVSPRNATPPAFPSTSVVGRSARQAAPALTPPPSAGKGAKNKFGFAAR